MNEFHRLRQRKTKYILTISSSFGTLDKKSSISLLGIVFGRIILRENFAIPQKSKSKRIGIKWRAIVATISNTAANHVNSGTEKLKVLQRRRS